MKIYFVLKEFLTTPWHGHKAWIMTRSLKNLQSVLLYKIRWTFKISVLKTSTTHATTTVVNFADQAVEQHQSFESF